MRRLSVLLGVLAALVLSAGIATAEPPPRLAERVTDRAGVLAPGQAAEIEAAIQRLRAEDGVDLFVVFVESFDGAGGQDWADDAATTSQLGDEDVLLAVAVTDRAYGVSVAEGFPLSESTVDDIRSEQVEPRLGADDWAGAAVAMADGLRTGGGGGFPTGLVVAGGLAVAGVGAYALHRRKQARGKAPASDAPDEFGDRSTEDLAYRASAALIEVDDAVRTSEQELTAARAHFGDEAVAGFAAALEQSRADMLRAFTLRQRLDDNGRDDEPEDERTQRALHGEIIAIAAAADDRLDAHVDAFDAMRGLEARAPEYVAELQIRLDAVVARLPQAETAWSALQARYAATALEPVDGDIAQARELLTAAASELEEARAGLTAPGSAAPDDGVSGQAAAVVDARAAEDAVTQAETLLDGIARRESELADATARVPAARAEAEQDLAEARAIGGDALAPVVARAGAAIAAAGEAASSAQPDPIAALRLLGEAGSALDAGIAEARAAADRQRHAAAALEQSVLTARSTVAAAEDFVATRRGAVGPHARTRLAEARRHLQQAGGPDPVAALREAQQADALAQEALRLARADVTQWSRPASSTGVDLGSLILGGILSGAAGGYRSSGRRQGGGFHRSPGSFGGSSRRGRRGGGGRF
ncbi:TPM domain-containing protein [Pseudonocardia sp. MH-G8]|uniref:TPM domain-containing protein n=1 Tax=Pseudonocardia sp. MH-G8 TaxID=1854588 RepID=UPI000BA16655|nr:TPM domain-containing protein [Pseudonocardia sp. MH-G8]OZM82749.1 methanol dehydrogenase [Pseudonocardia sp. MH-G8]